MDGLHRRSGIPAEAISELHGDIYVEVCTKCSEEHFRPFDVRGTKQVFTFSASFSLLKMQFVQSTRTTGRLCEKINSDGTQCLGQLKDTISTCLCKLSFRKSAS